MKGGSRAVKEHKWFQGMDWEAVYNGQVSLLLARAQESHQDSNEEFLTSPETKQNDNQPEF